MRYLLHFGLFAIALTAVTQADAQDRRRGDRHTTVVIARHGSPHEMQPRPRSYHKTPRAMYDYDDRRRFHDEWRDLQQIVDISQSWEHAVATRNRRAMLITDRRLDAWVERELREARREGRGHPHSYRIFSLSRQLDALQWRFESGRARRPHYLKKARILDELVELSERRVYRARAYRAYPVRFSFAHR